MIPCVLCHHPTQAPQTCSTCVNGIIRNLNAIETDVPYVQLELWFRGAPATPPDPTGTRSNNDGLSTTLVLLAPGATREHSDTTEIDSIPARLERWDTSWRIYFRELAEAKPATISRCVYYLKSRTLKAANEHDPYWFTEYRDDIQTMRRHLQTALHDGPQYNPVPCTECGRPMLEPTPPLPNGRQVEYRCLHCHTTYEWSQFWLAARLHEEAV